MKGNTLTRSLNAFRHMAMRPDHAAKWAQNRLDRKPPIDQGLPWFSYTAIECLAKLVKPGMRVLEWGGGGSTVFFAQRGCKVTTIEDHAGWATKFSERLAALKLESAVEVRLIPASSRKAEDIRAYIESFAHGGPWDIIVVDGLEEEYISRVDCIRFMCEHLDRIAPGGLVILDDAWRPEYDLVPGLLSGFRHELNWGLGPSRFGVTRTDFYWKS